MLARECVQELAPADVIKGLHFEIKKAAKPISAIAMLPSGRTGAGLYKITPMMKPKMRPKLQVATSAPRLPARARQEQGQILAR